MTTTTTPTSTMTTAAAAAVTEETDDTPLDEWKEVEVISNQVRRALECPVCLTLATDMTSLCTNGHAVCGKCVIELWSSDYTHHCPMCRFPMELESPTAMIMKFTEIIEKVRLSCDYRRFGCDELHFVHDIPEHERVCPYKPNVYCLASACQWVGNYDQLQGHVSRAHSGVFVESTNNSLSVDNVNQIPSKQRRTYLVRSPTGMFWVVLTRVRRSNIRTGVFMVENGKPPGSAGTGQSQTSGPSAESTPKLRYRVKWSDSEGRSQSRLKTKWVGLSSSLLEDVRGGNRGTAESYTVVKSRTGSMEFSWFPYPAMTGGRF